MSIEFNKNYEHIIDDAEVCGKIWTRLQKELDRPVGLPELRALIDKLVPEAIQSAYTLGRISGRGEGHVTGIQLISELHDKISAAIHEAVKSFPRPDNGMIEKA